MIGLIVETKDYSKAISILIRMIEVDPNHQESFSLLASFEKANDPVLAITSFEKSWNRPNDAVMHLNLGIAFQRQGDVEKAIEHSQKALTIKPDYAEAYSNLGNVLKGQCKLDEAIDAYSKAISVSPNNAVAYNNMGNALQDLDKIDGAT